MNPIIIIVTLIVCLLLSVILIAIQSNRLIKAKRNYISMLSDTDSERENNNFVIRTATDKIRRLEQEITNGIVKYKTLSDNAQILTSQLVDKDNIIHGLTKEVERLNDEIIKEREMNAYKTAKIYELVDQLNKIDDREIDEIGHNLVDSIECERNEVCANYSTPYCVQCVGFDKFLHEDTEPTTD